MIINLNVKIKGGSRTPVEVDVYFTAVNTKVMRFQNGREVSENAMAAWIETYLSEMLTGIQNE